MARVSQNTMEKLNEFFNTLPTEARNKCALCNETLTHIVKTAEAQTGAPTATVTRELAARVNDGAASGDVVSGNALRNRVQNAEGIKCSDRANKTEAEPQECPICKSVYPGDHKACPNGCEKVVAKKPESTDAPTLENLDARHFCFQAVGNLRSIPQDDTSKVTELMRVLDYIIEQIHDSGNNDALAICANKLESYMDHKKAPAIPNCHKRNLSTEERDEILFQVEKLFPGRDDGWKRACALNEAGLKCGRDKKSFWTPKDVRDNLRHAKNRQTNK